MWMVILMKKTIYYILIQMRKRKTKIIISNWLEASFPIII